MTMIKIIIGGDVCPMGELQDAFIAGDVHSLYDDLLEPIKAADLAVANLECPLISKDTPIRKPGIRLAASVHSIHGIVKASWHVLNLANNHCFDHGVNGLQETILTIKNAGLNSVGAGMNIREARLPYITTIKDQQIVIYAMAEREYSIAGEKTAGANPLDLIDFIHAIHSYKQNRVFIVLLHGGKENYSYPSPEMIRRCRFMVEMGADAVICCHTHGPLPWEIYAGRPIIYGLGNLLFENDQPIQEEWHEGYLAEMTINGPIIAFNPIPYLQCKTKPGAKKMDDGVLEEFLQKMHSRNAHLQESEFLNARWIEHCQQKKDAYLLELIGFNLGLRKLGSLLLHALHSSNTILTALHLAQCETHQEVLNTIFKLMTQDDDRPLSNHR